MLTRTLTMMLLLAASLHAQVDCGDCDSNGVAASIVDALRAAQMAAGLSMPSPVEGCACDVDSDGMVSVLDALRMAQEAAGLGAGLLCPMNPCGNTAPGVTIVAPVTGVHRGPIQIVLDLVDPSSDPLDVRVEYSAGGPFLLATSTGGGAITTNPAAAVAPAAGLIFEWDTVADMIASAGATAVTLRVTATDPGMLSAQDTSAFDVNNQTLNWVRAFPVGSTPGSVGGAILVHDSVRDRIVLYGGGDSGFNPIPNTWEWDGSVWLRKLPSSFPTAALGPMVAFDEDRGVSVLFGGQFNLSTPSNETWEWDGTNWTQRFPATVPIARGGGGAAYDTSRDRTVIFGGIDYSTGTSYGDTWEWDGVDWAQRSPATSPSVRAGGPMVYDNQRDVCVLFGGAATSMGLPDDETWEYDGNTWTQVFTTTGPSPRATCGMMYDSTRGITVLFGGVSGLTTPVLFNDTWHYDGNEWTLVTPATSPSLRATITMVFDPVRDAGLLHGGVTPAGATLGDTWQYR